MALWRPRKRYPSSTFDQGLQFVNLSPGVSGGATEDTWMHSSLEDNGQ
jgi:hypothetical protein